jgi:hypothetical protein
MRRVFSNTVKPIYVAVRRAGIRTLEHCAGISTQGYLTPQQLGFSPEHRVRYEPSHWMTLWRILQRDEVGREDVFVDFGSGMGRVLYQAAVRYPFRRIEGVELSADLTAIAAGNIERNRHKFLCQDVRLVTSDVLEYEIPDDLTVAYFHNPFQGPIFAAVVERLVVSVKRNPRRLRLVYLNPVEDRMLLDAGFRGTRRLRGLRPGSEWSRSNSTRMYELP